MSPRPLIFISAVSQELRSARQLVANTLTFLGYDPIWQDIFETSEGDLPGVLRKQISRCNGVVQLVGCCYGAEPPQPTEEFGRVSYTQYEALYARKIGKKVWYLFLDEHFPSDACVDESEELRALQSAYRNRLKADTHLYHPLTTLEGLEASVLKLRGDLMHLRRGAKRWAAGVAIVLLAGLAVNFSLLHWQRHTSQQMIETQHAVTSVSEQVTRLREGIVQYIQVEGKIREGQTETGLVRDQVYEQLGKQMNMDVAVLREKLPLAAEQLRDAPNASPFERASAAYVANDYQEAERLAIQAAVQARNATPTNNADMIRALKLAGFAAQKQIKYATAMAHLREAAELTNRERDPGQWAEIQHAIADVLIDQGQYREAATVLQGALEARASAFGPENPDTLRSRNRLAYALWRQGRFRDAEAEFRKLIAVEERLLGAQHPETLASENGLANALDDEGKHADAESEHRRVLELRSKVLGPESPETLKSRNNLALALNREQKYAEAEKLFRELIIVEERVLGPEHPETLRSRRNLLVSIGNQGRHAEAETGFRDLLAVQERMLGPDHPDTLGVRNNIGHAVAQQSRFADAEAQFRDVIRIEAKILGPEHPATLSSRMALAGVLNEQQKHAEADTQCREVIALEENALGPDHPTTISSWYAFAYQLARQNKTEEALQFARKAASAAGQTLGQDHPDTRKYAQLVQQLESQQPGADQANIKPVKAGVPEYTAGEAKPKATSALLVDPTSGQPIGRETYNGSVKVEYSDGRSEIFCKDGNCADPHVSHEGHVGWTHHTHRGHRNAAMNERLVIRFSNGQTKEFKPNPNGGPFIEKWNFIDNDAAVAIKSRGYHGPASFVRYDLISGRMTGHQDGYVEYEKMPEWAQPFSDDIPFGLHAPTTEPSPAASKPKSAEAQQTEQVTRTTEASPQSPLPGTNILGSPAQSGIADVTVLVEFTGNGATNKGSGPNGLIFASDGDIYGTTENGGANDYGTVFKMTPAGALSTIVGFAGNATINSSGFPMAPLIERHDGDFYGTTSGGGVGPTGENNLDNGTIFKLSRSGVLTTLVRFSCTGATNKGCTPYSGLVQSPNGDFYGTTFSGGSGKAVPIPGFRGFGTIYKMSPAGQLTTLYDFSAHLAKGQGGAPWAGLTLGRDGNLYGTTWGGLGVAGTIFKLTPTGAMTTLVRFGIKPPNKKGGGCTVELLQASDGNFYGTCPIGGGGNGGTVFKMTPSGAFTNLVEFSNNDPKGAQPHAPLAEGNDGNLYGTTTVGGAYNYGTIFRVTPSGLFKVLWNFNNPNKIHECQHPGTGPLLKDKEGNFYGTTKWGGRSDWGTVFKLTLHSFDMQASTAPPANSPSGATSQPAQTEQAQGSAPRDDFKTAKQKLIAHDAAHHEYTAAEAPKHIGETATVVGKVGCVDAGRTFHCLPLDGCMPNSPFWIIVNDDASGPELNIQDLKGVTIAVSGKIENRDGQPWLIVKSTTQIRPRTSLNTDYISRAHQKEADGDVDGAIELFGRAIEHQPDRRAEAYEFRGRAKERKGDWNGALADYDALVAVDPNKADFYYIRATQKKQHGQFEAAMADYQKAAELRSSPSDYIQMGNWRKEKGDITGAAAEYDKAIALCDRQIAGTGKSEPRSPLGSDPYFSRGCARELKGDLDGAVADYTQAIANNPARAAMAYGARGNIRRARGDLSGAIADYQHKYQITHYPDDEEKLKKAKAEGKKQRVANPSEANAPAEAPAGEKQTSPGGTYSVEVVRNNEDSLVLLKGGGKIGKVSTQVGPVDSLFEVLWSADGKYVAVNKQRSSRAGGDSMFIFALPSGKLLRRPDDALWGNLDERAGAFIDEKHLTETSGKVFLSLTATGWDKDRLRFRVEAGFGEIADRYFFEGTVDPLDLKTIADWKVSKAK